MRDAQSVFEEKEANAAVYLSTFETDWDAPSYFSLTLETIDADKMFAEAKAAFDKKIETIKKLFPDFKVNI